MLGPASWEPVRDVLLGLGHEAVVASPSMTTTADIDHVTPWINDLLETEPPDENLATVLVTHSAACPRAPLAVDHLIGKGWAVEAMILVDGRFPDGRAFTDSVPQYGTMLDGMIRPDDYLPPWPRWWGSLVEGLVVDPVARDHVFNEAKPVPRSWFDQPCPVPELPSDVGRGFLSFGPGYQEACNMAELDGWLTRRLVGDHLHQVVAPVPVADTLQAMATELRTCTGR